MKKWKEPILTTLSVENTQDKPKIPHTDANQHFCHDTGLECTGDQNQHSASGNKPHKFSGKKCTDENHKDLDGNSSCCCFS